MVEETTAPKRARTGAGVQGEAATVPPVIILSEKHVSDHSVKENNCNSTKQQYSFSKNKTENIPVLFAELSIAISAARLTKLVAQVVFPWSPMVPWQRSEVEGIMVTRQATTAEILAWGHNHASMLLYLARIPELGLTAANCAQRFPVMEPWINLALKAASKVYEDKLRAFVLGAGLKGRSRPMYKLPDFATSTEAPDVAEKLDARFDNLELDAELLERLRASLPEAARSTEVTIYVEAYARWYLLSILSGGKNACKGGRKTGGNWYCPEYIKKVDLIMAFANKAKARRAAAAVLQHTNGETTEHRAPDFVAPQADTNSFG